MKTGLLTASLFLLASCFLPTLVRAQSINPEAKRIRVEGFGRLGFAGEIDVEFGDTALESDLELGLGFGVGIEYVIHPNFSLGARGQVLFTELEADASDHSAVDLNLVPKARYPLPDAPGALFAAFPFGLSIIWSELGEAEDDTETGFNIALLFGGEFFLSSTIGLFFEMGYQWHFFSRQTLSTELDITAGNLLLQAGAKFAF